MKRYVMNKFLADFRDNVENIVRDLVKECINLPEKLIEELNWLVTDEAENGYLFGRILGELDEEYYWLEIILDAVKKSENPSVYNFVGGYLSSVKLRDAELWERTLYRCYDDEILKKFLLEIIWRSGTSDKAVKLIIRMLKDKEIQPQEVFLLTYGAWFSDVSPNSFMEFLEELYKIEDGKYVAGVLGIIDQYAETHPGIISDAKNILLKYLTRPEIFKSDLLVRVINDWHKLSNELMDEFNDIIPYFLALILNILRENPDFFILVSIFREKFEYFLNVDFENTWNKLKEALLANDLCAGRLIFILREDYANFDKEKKSLLKLIPEAHLWKWVEENPDKASIILARMIPLHESEPDLHPLARELLIRYPNNENIALELSANWHREIGWSGSESLYYESKIRIAKKWAEDPETSVANWAKIEVDYYENKFKNAKREEEEMGF